MFLNFLDPDEVCFCDHTETEEAIKDLIDALYNNDEVNVDYVEMQIEVLARNYNISIPPTRLKLERGLHGKTQFNAETERHHERCEGGTEGKEEG